MDKTVSRLFPPSTITVMNNTKLFLSSTSTTMNKTVRYKAELDSQL